MPAGASLTPGLPDAPADAEAAQPFAAVAAEAAEPRRAVFHDVAHPVQGLEVVFQRRPAEQAHLGDVGRAHARLAALALDAFDHGGLFAADVGARAAAQARSSGSVHRRVGLQQRPARPPEWRGSRGTRRAGRCSTALMPTTCAATSTPFQKPVRVALQVGAVLEGAGLAFVDVDGHQLGRGCSRTMRHLRPAGKPAPPRPRKPESSMAWMHRLGRLLAVGQRRRQRVAAPACGRPGIARVARARTCCGTAAAARPRPRHALTATKSAAPTQAGWRGTWQPIYTH